MLGIVDGQPLSHALGDIKSFKAATAKLVKEKVDQHDDVAEAEAIKEQKRAEMVERMKGVGKDKTEGKTKTAS